MLRSLESLKHFRLDATDGEIGSIKDIYFDDEEWKVRYFVASTGSWLLGSIVLIPAASVLDMPDWSRKSIPVSLTKDQIKNSPASRAHRPVSRQEESRLYAYYGLSPYWSGTGAAHAVQQEMKRIKKQHSDESSHLRSLNEVMGYHIAAMDNTFGHLEDLITDDQNWTLRYMVIDTKNWLPAKQVLIPPSRVSDISWSNRTVTVRLTEEELKNSPEYRSTDAVNRKREERLYDYYGRPRYWRDDDHGRATGSLY